jgi:hypothetical protein
MMSDICKLLCFFLLLEPLCPVQEKKSDFCSRDLIKHITPPLFSPSTAAQRRAIDNIR